MKRVATVSILMFSLFCIASYGQSNEYSQSLAKMQKLNGTMGTYDVVFNQLKAMKPNVNDSAWTAVKKDVYDVQIQKLNEQLVPVYQKHFSLEDINQLIAFYETPIGKKLATETPLITGESMQVSQQWGMALMKEIQDYLDTRGLDKMPYGIQKVESSK